MVDNTVYAFGGLNTTDSTATAVDYWFNGTLDTNSPTMEPTPSPIQQNAVGVVLNFDGFPWTADEVNGDEALQQTMNDITGNAVADNVDSDRRRLAQDGSFE